MNDLEGPARGHDVSAGTRPGTHSTTRTSFIRSRNGRICLGLSGGDISITIAQSRFHEIMFVIWRDGMHRSILMKILRRPSAVWLTPRGGWRKRYRGWGAMTKLRYMERIAHELGSVDPVRRRGYPDITVDEMESTSCGFYQQSVPEAIPVVDLALDSDLIDIFNVSKRQKKTVRPAQEFLRQHRKTVVDKVTYWTGVQRPLIIAVGGRHRKEDRRTGIARRHQEEAEHLAELTVYATTLATNYMTRGKFVQP